MIDLIKELKGVLEKKQISPETAAQFIGTSGREVRRWLAGEATPNVLSRKAIRTGFRRIERNL
jgi:DNA-binding transcriptional regulator YiaG